MEAGIFGRSVTYPVRREVSWAIEVFRPDCNISGKDKRCEDFKESSLQDS